MPDEHVAAAPRHTRGVERVGRERLGQAVVEPAERVEGVEDLPVAGRTRVPPLDDVATVLAVFARGMEELLALRQRILEFLAERGRIASGDLVYVAVDFQQNSTPRRVASRRE